MSTAVSAAVGIGVGINSLTGGAITNMLGMGSGGGGGNAASGGANQVYDPYGPYRQQAATQLNSLINNPSLAMSQPGYQGQLQQGMSQANASAAASGNLNSGMQQSALMNQGQNTFSSYYNNQLGILEQLSGATQNPAQAGLAQSQANMAQQQMGMNSMGTMMGMGQALNTMGNANGWWGGGGGGQFGGQGMMMGNGGNLSGVASSGNMGAFLSAYSGGGGLN